MWVSVRQTLDGHGAAAWLVIHGAAGMCRESQRRLWDVRYTAIHSWVGTIGVEWREVGLILILILTVERRVERWVAQRWNVCPEWLINYPVHPVYRIPVL